MLLSRPLTIAAIGHGEIGCLKRLFILPKGRIIVWLRHAKILRQPPVEQASALELLKAGKIADRLKSKMNEKILGCPIGDRAAGRAPAAAQLNPAGLEQEIERALRDRNAPYVLDFGARHRLVIGDDGQGFESGTGKPFRLARPGAQQPSEIGGGSEHPLGPCPDEVDAARGVIGLK